MGRRFDPPRGGKPTGPPRQTPGGQLLPFPTAADVPTNRCANLGLLFDRFVRWKSDWTLEGEDKKQEFKRVVEAAKLWQDEPAKRLLNEIQARQNAILASFQKQGYATCSETLEMDWRLAVGLGRESVLETGFATHRVYGLPLIPGSALKGLTAAYAQLVAGVGPQDNSFRLVFGSQESKDAAAGGVIFFDAFPAHPPRLKLDVMNPHYGPYYRGEQDCGRPIPPADYLSPVPVYFLTVEQTPFLFTLAARNRTANDHLKTAMGWLKAALAEMGAGAKTTSGYGYFGGGS